MPTRKLSPSQTVQPKQTDIWDVKKAFGSYPGLHCVPTPFYSSSLVTHLKLASSFSMYAVEQDRGYKNTSTESIEPESGDGFKNRTFCVWLCRVWAVWGMLLGGLFCKGRCPLVLGPGDSGFCPGFSKLARLGGHARKTASKTHTGWAGALWVQAKWSRGWEPGPVWWVVSSLLSSLASEGLAEARVPLS